MKALIKHVPIPLSGVALALASLGQLLGALWGLAHALCGVVALVLIVLVACRAIAFPASIRADLKDPVLAGVAGTFPMCIMVLSSYVVPASLGLAFGIWIVAIALHALLVVNFVVQMVRGDAVAFLTPASFVVLIGMVVADLPGAAYPARGFCVGLFWVELVVTVVLMVAVTVRYARRPLRKEPARPLLCIYAAPPNMLLACYFAVSGSQSAVLVGILAAFSLACYVFGLVSMLRCLRLRFYPSYAAMTFPFVISTSASYSLAAHLSGQPVLAGAVHLVGNVQLAIATCIVLYVLVRYLMFLAHAARADA